MEENLDKNVNKMWIKILLIEEPLIKQLQVRSVIYQNKRENSDLLN